MVKGTNAEQALAGEASCSRRKRQQVPSIVEEEGENGVGDVVAQSGTLFELDLLDCPVCCHALTSPIFQCDNGHIACSSCCTNLRNKCPACTLPIGEFRCLIMEKVVEAVIVPCPNTKHGCTDDDEEEEEGENGGGTRTGDVVKSEARSGTLFDLHLLDCPVCSNALTSSIFQQSLSHAQTLNGCTETFFYGKELVHEKECGFSLCYCPSPNCKYSGVYKDLYSHYATKHKVTGECFRYGDSIHACMNVESKFSVFQKYTDGPLVVLQCFKEPYGLFFTVNCIAPSAPGVGKLSYKLSYSTAGDTLTFRSSEMNRIQKVSFQTPEKDFMFVPDYFLTWAGGVVKCMRLCIRSLEEEEEEEEEDDAEEEYEADEEDEEEDED
ncbi:LOW QUALITY PROTEIN: E3 ubiquitin-protein ligase SINA-like 1 [Arabidopsis lyrata subsp. lyrata]|uniref:LOW QUALITY PROTEIN: E3 ubiquitin-protein ligase SINA-like 1 n=1 Tax=Arabidopsis lyrata subsp. lyrata TaxID=81972 RepID=UPI000A29D66B|nr:LOW QUALITY PROTEIN: E3 ubiquitin-protein ligase SINA-like 1 [Arabidopsis lyrata subsp. lyrata]|eukprot:XP_020865653.1 LOW QUALITY PROTEIN: E3 ubiquitin-protein ligase SINA-like 1 [Arabidopsis lyrata subsp. lyrata]